MSDFDDRSRAPLAGIKVVDLTRALAGPYCALMLGDMGADVVKIEQPGRGDEARTWGPPFTGDDATYFYMVNRNKRSVVLDLKSELGQEALRRLVQRCDVLVENFSPGTMERLGMPWSVAHELNPRLVYASISGFGQTGPYRTKPAYDHIVQGMSGLMSVTGPLGGPPTRVGVSIADMVAGMFTAYAIAVALYEREQSGEGQYIDTAMLGGLVSLLANQAAIYFGTGRSPEPMGNGHPQIVPYGTYQTADGFVNIAIGNEGHWQRMCRALEIPHLLEDPRFQSNRDRFAHRAEVLAEFEPAVARFTTAEVVRRLDEASVPVGPIYRLHEVFADPQSQHLRLERTVPHPAVGRVSFPGLPYRLSRTPPGVFAAPPMLGQHTDEVLAELGLLDR